MWHASSSTDRHAPSGTYYDNGGPLSNYIHANWTYTIAPIGATTVSLVFSQAAGNAADLITIYDGPNTSSPILFGPAPLSSLPLSTPFIGTRGRLTINFDGDNSANTLAAKGAGWVATWTSDAPPWTATWIPATNISDATALMPYVWPTTTTNYSVTYSNGTCNLTHTAVVTVTADPTPNPPANFAGADVAKCAADPAVQLGTVLPKATYNLTNNAVYRTNTGIVYDNGGPAANYGQNLNWVVTLQPAGAQEISLTFTEGIFFRGGGLCAYI